ncbi:MAG: S-layer homology domain-containing protein [Lawsonibacter sp.]|nr:S-layer homology domain-containing protein [Lawsonibacter sp.]
MKKMQQFLSSVLAVALYRAARSPAVEPADFSDVPAESSYASAAAWAKTNGVIAGYEDGRFGGEDSITREQIVTILWRYSGGSAAERGEDFTDESSIPSPNFMLLFQACAAPRPLR